MTRRRHGPGGTCGWCPDDSGQIKARRLDLMIRRGTTAKYLSRAIIDQTMHVHYHAVVRTF